MRAIKFASFMAGVCLWQTSCAPPKYSPWQTDLESSQKGATARNLQWLSESESPELPFTIAILGDPQGTPGDLKKTVRAINQVEDVKFLLVLGDLTDHGLKHEYEWAFEGLNQSRVPWFTAIGNHDAISHGKEIYSKMFGPSNYTFEYAGLKFLMWNNNKYEFNTSSFDWLEQEVDSRSVIASHIPPVVDVHSAEEVDYWTDLTASAGALTSMHGHRGGSRSFFWHDQGVPYYIVARTEHVNFALVTFHEDYTVSYEHCHIQCESQK